MNTQEWVHYTVHKAEMDRVERQRDKLIEALHNMLYYGDRSGTKEYVDARKQARSALEEIQ